MGPPKITPSKKGNTLFSYFSKSPSVNKNNSSINSTDEVLSPKRSPNQKDKSTANSTPKQTPKSAKTNDELSSGIVDHIVVFYFLVQNLLEIGTPVLGDRNTGILVLCTRTVKSRWLKTSPRFLCRLTAFMDLL